MASTSRKRNISELLAHEEDGTSEFRTEDDTPRTRQKLDEPQAPSATRSPEPERVQHSPTFLAYPNPRDANIKPRQIPFQQPSQLTSFSYTPDHVQVFDNSALRYFVDPPLGANLSYGYERWTRKPDDRGRIDSLLKAVSKVKEDARQSGGALPEIGVMAWRGIMTKIMTAPYEERDGWDLNVMLKNGTLYFEEHLSEERLKEKNNMNPRQRSQTYYGYAFESYCTHEDPALGQSQSARAHGDPPGWGGDVDTNIQWCSVARTKLGDIRMIIGGEVDCVRGKYTGQPDTFVELKTSLAIRGHHDEVKFERKLLKFYFQSFLLGVPEIVVGFRTPAGVITTVQSFKTIQMPRMVRGKPHAWDPLLCLDWGHRVLTFLKETIRSRERIDDAELSSVPVWRVKFVPGSGITVEKLNREEIADVVNGEDRVGFLPQWYWEELEREHTGEEE